MSVGYSAIQWNRHKRVYDAALAAGLVLYVALFTGASLVLWSGEHAVSAPVLAMRALGSCAALLLHVILCIGPLARLNPRFLPLLYNRRHLGVAAFLLALVHAIIAIGYYHGFGVLNPLVSLLSVNTNYASITAFPFQVLGLGTLAVMFLMAATSHDFWLKNLGAAAWKRLHMLVYPAYALLVGHVALGPLQTARGPLAPAVVGLGVALVVGLHLWAGWRETRRDRAPGSASTPADDPMTWIDAGPPDNIPADRARIVCAAAGGGRGGERIAVFRHKDGVSAVTNVCAHQGGPLGEGKIVDGCITCPWHGWQYRPLDGCSPPPFTEKIATHHVRIVAGRVRVDPRARLPGTPLPPARPDEVPHG
ncbi:MAG: Rieske 2Fe-2S domain-containing protein [Phycisphaerales bacterium]